MRPSAIVLVGMLVSCGVLVLAGDADPAPGAVEYTVETPPGALFVETFQGDWESTWTHSQSEAYAGRFAAEPYKVDGISGDVGIAMPEEAKRYGLSRKLDVPVDMTKAPVVVQYEVSLKEGLDCGGAYLKLLNVDGNFRGEDLVESTPYSIMFGPDKCANAGKVHFIVRFRNPVSGEVTEHHLRSPDGHSLKLPPTHDIVPITHLYRFVLLGDNRILISVDDSTPKEVNMLTDLDPPINPSKEIDDPADTKPEDWVDEKEIFDPNQVKPDDWDEDLPIHIPDPDAIKPADWYDDEPFEIHDPEATQPPEWDEEDDGVWAPPLVPNPKCSNPGCGEWRAPMIPNPDFKGKWFPDKIPNPAYKGEFKPRRIPHPAYFEDSEPWKSLLPVSAVALELWTMNKGVLFDNMLITHSEEEARDFAQRTWAKRHEAEKAEEKARSDKLEREKMGTTMVEKAVYYASKAAKLVEEQPIPAGVAIFSVFLALIALCFMPARGPLPHQVTARQPPAVPEHKAGKDAVVKDESPDSKPRQRTTRRTAKADS